jgi:hypothetical protein
MDALIKEIETAERYGWELKNIKIVNGKIIKIYRPKK